MKVVVSSLGRFHSFRLARQLDQNKVLYCLYSGDFVRFYDKVSRVKQNKILLLLRLLEIGGYFIDILRKTNDRLFYYKIKLHEDYVAEDMKKEEIDIFVGWLGCSKRVILEARNRGIITIIECGSAHPIFHNKIIKEEYKNFLNKNIDVIPENMIESHLLEIESADYISVPSNFVKNTFIEQGVSEKKIIVVPYGVDLSQFKKIEKKDDIFRIIWCGNIKLSKGIHYLLQAFYELNLNNSELILIGSVEDDMKIFIKKYKMDNIRFLGPKRQKELYKYLSNSSVFVHPSITEGLSMVLLEGMACGLPIIFTTNSGGHEIIRDNVDGFEIPIRNVEEMKKKIEYLYKNPLILKNMSDSSYERVKDFTWDKYGENIIKEYEKILKH